LLNHKLSISESMQKNDGKRMLAFWFMWRVPACWLVKLTGSLVPKEDHTWL
jgi:hypothetical protein